MDNKLSGLLKLAALKLGVSEAQLKDAIEKGDFSSLKNIDSNKLNEAMKNPEIQKKAQDLFKNMR